MTLPDCSRLTTPEQPSPVACVNDDQWTRIERLASTAFTHVFGNADNSSPHFRRLFANKMRRFNSGTRVSVAVVISNCAGSGYGSWITLMGLLALKPAMKVGFYIRSIIIQSNSLPPQQEGEHNHARCQSQHHSQKNRLDRSHRRPHACDLANLPVRIAARLVRIVVLIWRPWPHLPAIHFLPSRQVRYLPQRTALTFSPYSLLPDDPTTRTHGPTRRREVPIMSTMDEAAGEAACGVSANPMLRCCPRLRNDAHVQRRRRSSHAD
jgi:hypothetical protein